MIATENEKGKKGMVKREREREFLFGMNLIFNLTINQTINQTNKRMNE